MKGGLKMKKVKRFISPRLAVIGIAAIAIGVLALTPALGSSLKKTVKKEVTKQLKNKTGPAGPTGPTGPTGPAGPTGTVTERQNGTVSVADPGAGGGTNTGTAVCNAGEISIGGGGTMQGIPNVTSINNSHRSGTNGWTVTGWNDSGSSVNLLPVVECLKL
jgi:hypothetical protein